jgi:hypothetical protein
MAMESRELLAEIVGCIDRFVPHTPSRAVESLPWDMGGVQRADIPAQVLALQAKVAAMLPHPRRQAWKTLMRRAFQRHLPALPGACDQRVWRGETPGRWSTGSALLACTRTGCWRLMACLFTMRHSCRSGLPVTAASPDVVRRVGCRRQHGGCRCWDQQWQTPAA